MKENLSKCPSEIFKLNLSRARGEECAGEGGEGISNYQYQLCLKCSTDIENIATRDHISSLPSRLVGASNSGGKLQMLPQTARDSRGVWAGSGRGQTQTRLALKWPPAPGTQPRLHWGFVNMNMFDCVYIYLSTVFSNCRDFPRVGVVYLGLSLYSCSRNRNNRLTERKRKKDTTHTHTQTSRQERERGAQYNIRSTDR